MPLSRTYLKIGEGYLQVYISSGLHATVTNHKVGGSAITVLWRFDWCDTYCYFGVTAANATSIW